MPRKEQCVCVFVCERGRSAVTRCTFIVWEELDKVW